MPLARIYGIVNSPACTADGKYPASWANAHEMKVLDISSSAEVASFTSEDPASATGSLAFSTDNRFLAAVTQNGAVVWELGTRTVRRKISGEVRGLAFSPDGETLAAGGLPGIVDVYKVNGGPAVTSCRSARLSHIRGAFGIRFAPAGDVLAFAGVSGVAGICDTHRDSTATVPGPPFDRTDYLVCSRSLVRGRGFTSWWLVNC